MISFDEKNATFTLTGKGMIYAMGVSDGVLEHRYFGAPIHAGDDLSLFRGEAAGSFEARMPGTVSQNQISAEAPAYGRGDYREPRRSALPCPTPFAAFPSNSFTPFSTTRRSSRVPPGSKTRGREN